MRIVQKFGGTSVGSIERIESVAQRIKAWVDTGCEVVVVVSAMSGETNRLTSLARALSDNPNPREMDSLLSSGEQVTMSLLSMALQELEVEAISYTGWQVGIRTDKAHTKARILSIDKQPMTQALADGKVVIIAGFQGVTEDGHISTLGRGGSDTSAVAVAAAIEADECQIYTDVDGVYTTDPRIVSDARRLATITYEEMLELASLGAKVLQIRSVELAYKQKVPIRVLSSWSPFDADSITNVGGTLIYPESDQKNMEENMDSMESPKIAGVAFNKDEAQIKIKGVPDKPGVAFTLLSAIADANIEVDMIVQNTSDSNFTDLTFTVNRSDYQKALEITNRQAVKVEAKQVVGNDKIVKVSLVGVGMRSHAGIASQMFKAMSQAEINILIISTSEIKISVGIDEQHLSKAVQVLHKEFDLAVDPNHSEVIAD